MPKYLENMDKILHLNDKISLEASYLLDTSKNAVKILNAYFLSSLSQNVLSLQQNYFCTTRQIDKTSKRLFGNDYDRTSLQIRKCVFCCKVLYKSL